MKGYQIIHFTTCDFCGFLRYSNEMAEGFIVFTLSVCTRVCMRVIACVYPKSCRTYNFGLRGGNPNIYIRTIIMIRRCLACKNLSVV